MSTGLESTKNQENNISESYVIDELNQTIEYLSENQEEIDGLQTSDGDYWVSVPEIVQHSDLELGGVEEDIVETVDEYMGSIAVLRGMENFDKINRYESEFDENSFGRKYWCHRKQKGSLTELLTGKSTEMPHFRIPGTDELLDG